MTVPAALGSESLLSINWPTMAGDQEFEDTSGSIGMSMIGGGGYSLFCKQKFQVPTIVLVDDSSDDILYHELGHIKQDLELGANSDTCNNWVLEYHNVLTNENEYHVSVGNDIRIYYDKSQRCLNKVPPGKDWATFRTEVVAHEATKSAKTMELLDLIETALVAVADPEKVKLVKQNLMSEAYNRPGGILGKTKYTACI